MPCQKQTRTPIYDDAFFAEIERCPKSPPEYYCLCYDAAVTNSLIRAQQGNVNAARQAMIQAQDKYNSAKQYPRQTVVQGPPLNVPSRADQKKNTFSKVFNPKTRKILVLLIALFLIFLAATSYDG